MSWLLMSRSKVLKSKAEQKASKTTCMTVLLNTVVMKDRTITLSLKPTHFSSSECCSRCIWGLHGHHQRQPGRYISTGQQWTFSRVVLWDHESESRRPQIPRGPQSWCQGCYGRVLFLLKHFKPIVSANENVSHQKNTRDGSDCAEHSSDQGKWKI